MKKIKLEFIVGLFFIIGILAIIYLSVRMTSYELKINKGYEVKAIFDNSGGLNAGANVEVAGVPVGSVKKIYLEDYRAVLLLQIRESVQIPDDSMASIKTQGLLGEKFLEITPGASDDFIPPNGEIIDTQSPLDIEKAMGKFIFGKAE